MKAVYRNNPEIVKILVQNGDNVHAKNIGGLTALEIAETLRAQPEIVLTLRGSGSR